MLLQTVLIGDHLIGWSAGHFNDIFIGDVYKHCGLRQQLESSLLITSIKIACILNNYGPKVATLSDLTHTGQCQFSFYRNNCHLGAVRSMH